MENYENTVHKYAISCILGVKEEFLTPKKFPTNFYQYSALSTFRGVIEHNNLWATHWAYLNDTKELKKGIKVAKFVHSDSIIKGYFKSNHSFSDFEKLISKLTKKEIINKTDNYTKQIAKGNETKREFVQIRPTKFLFVRFLVIIQSFTLPSK